MAGGMEAENDFGARRTLDAEALGADGNPAIGPDFEGSAYAPNIGPPGATRGWAQDGAFFFYGKFPGSLWDHAQLAVGFVGVAVESQGVDVRVGDFDLGDVFAGKIGWESALPVLVFALDFSFGLGSRSIQETNVIELESPTQLGERLGSLREKDGVVIDVNLQGSPVVQESGGEEIQVGEQEFAAIDFGTDEEAAAIVEHIEHGKIQ